jgi:predicted DNA-binding transcriptional regulator YafY
MLPTERIARATWMLAQGKAVTVRALAAELEITPRGARSMLERMSRVVPLVDDGGVWRVMGEEREIERLEIGD